MAVDYKSTVTLFFKAENQLIKHRILQKEIFNDPIEIFENKLSVIKKEAPLILINTKMYEKHLIMMLSDSSLKRDQETNTDIIFILYHLCYNDYIKSLRSIFEIYKSKKIPFDDFSFAVYQDCFFSCQLVQNYHDEELKKLYKEVLIFISGKRDRKYIILKENLIGVLNGQAWEICKKDIKIQPPIIGSCNSK
ncbi:hypothetical protein FYC62_03495 [Pedobacter aquae]|uniref:Uncharacterized protein n=1 Tax=Pedobacter aquae TaxID=2605747 RepID=A0A5C0VDT0_9SPHI|nr:hypothetical protein [Pedobacter aquae]QEK50838.1 hypothetical protein FYC62_03495 [Pedobacter aquae]